MNNMKDRILRQNIYSSYSQYCILGYIVSLFIIYITVGTQTKVQYKIGAEFCIPRGDRRTYRISCNINDNLLDHVLSPLLIVPG